MERPGDKAFGALAEQVAAECLRKLGYRILERNVRFRGGELDLVAKQGDVLVFCEVKARRGQGSGEPGEAVDCRKRRKMALLAMDYLRTHPELSRLECRFDVVLLRQSESGWRSEVIPDAFRPGWE
ncbi:MAG: YraN family protein [Magnetococcales bacterium]|nr:YraN family protein [Magnetococcales bacterium]